MARTKEFAPERVLDKAMQLFWHRGYEATSVQDLLEGMGIGRGSLYDTFGDKHALFLAALDRYCARHGAQLIALLDQPGPVIPALRELFGAVVEEALAGDRRGCFMANSTLELASRDPAVARRAEANLAEMEAAFARALGRAMEAGEIRGDRDPRALGRYLFSALQGLKVTAKTTHDRGVLEDIVRVTLSALE